MDLTDYSLLHDLWLPRYQILSIIFRKEFIKSNVDTDTMTRNAKLA